MIDRDAGDRVSVKSGGGWEIVTVTVAEWVSIPEVAVRVSMALPDAAAADAVRIIVCGVPGVRVSMAGWAVTPLGNPAMATDTMPAKLLIGAAVMVICWADPPERRVMVAGEADKEKSVAGAGFDPPPPQAVRSKPTNVAQSGLE